MPFLSPSRSRSLSRSLSFLASLLLTACVTDGVTDAELGVRNGSFTADAATQWRFVSLSDSAIVEPTPSATESALWDIGFFSTNVTLNGGAAGPGGVSAACICQNAAATTAEILAMTPESEQADFDAVTTVPAGTVFVTDVLTPAIAGWFTGTGAAAVADTNKAWQVRLSDSTAYAVVRVLAIAGASATNAGLVALEFKVQPNGAAPLGAPDTILLNLATTQSLDLDTGALTASATAWDLRLEGFTIRVNGGVSGIGKGGAALSSSQFAATTTGVTSPNAYKLDVYAGVFGTSRWYKYNLAGDNRISPTFDVYLVRRGAATYKLQLINYYGPTGTPRQITFRWARLD